MDTAYKATSVLAWLAFSIIFRVVSSKATNDGYYLGLYMLSQGIVGFVTVVLFCPQLHSFKALKDLLSEMTSLHYFLIATHLVAILTLDMTLKHTMLLALLPICTSGLSHYMLAQQDKRTIVAILLISVGATMAAGGRCMMNSISVVLNLMAVLTFSFRNVLMKRHLSGNSNVTIVSFSAVLSLAVLALSVPILIAEVAFSAKPKDVINLSLLSGSAQGISNALSFFILQYFSAVAHSIVTTSGMVALYFTAATMMGRSHHWSFFPVLGFILNPLGIIFYALYNRNADLRQPKEKDEEPERKLDSRQMFLYFAGTVVILILSFLCNFSGKLPSLSNVKGFFYG